MSAPFLETLEEHLNDPNLFNSGKWPELLSETMAFFKEIEEKRKSNNPELLKQALQDTQELKKILDVKMQAICEKTGLQPEQLKELSANPKNMTPAEWEAVQEAKEKFKALHAPAKSIKPSQKILQFKS